jgi:diguanylate cyclase (GGDEF)-like protein
MTGVMNKSTFTYYFDSFVKSPEATRQYALAVFDLDGFKQINDDYGHQIGDHVLLAFAEFLKNFFGSLDRNTMLGRFGGDEFMLLIKDIDKEYLYLQFASFCKEIPEIIKEKTQLEVTCSVGVSISGGGQQEFQDMFLIADRALYQTKNNKKNSFTIFQSNTNRQA